MTFTENRVFADREERIHAFQERLVGHLAEERWAMKVCGPLDVGDERGLIPTGRVPEAEIAEVLDAALRSAAFDGVAGPRDPGATVVHGQRTVIRVQRHLHERFETALRTEAMRERAGVKVPALLDAGTVETVSGTRWWLVLERIGGPPGECPPPAWSRTRPHARLRRVGGSPDGGPTPARQRALGEQLRRWHDAGDRGGLRLDDPGALGVLLDSARRLAARDYPVISRLFDQACTGQPMTAIHGDVAVGHNALFEGDDLLGLLDPGAVEVGPPMLDLAWCLAVDLPRGAQPRWLLEGYGVDAVDREALDALLPLMILRRLIDSQTEGRVEDCRRLATWLTMNAPGTLPLAASTY